MTRLVTRVVTRDMELFFVGSAVTPRVDRGTRVRSFDVFSRGASREFHRLGRCVILRNDNVDSEDTLKDGRNTRVSTGATNLVVRRAFSADVTRRTNL